MNAETAPNYPNHLEAFDTKIRMAVAAFYADEGTTTEGVRTALKTLINFYKMEYKLAAMEAAVNAFFRADGTMRDQMAAAISAYCEGVQVRVPRI